jgi:transmembrane sensor
MNWEILIRYVNHEASEKEVAEIEAWLNERPQNKLILKQLELKHNQLNQPLKDEVVHAEWVKVLDRIFESPQQQKPKVKKLFSLIGIAAAVLLACFINLFSLNNNYKAANETVVVQTTSERRQVQLPDGSMVYLAPNSNLRVSGDFGRQKRALSLIGEAFFDVKHDAKKPFIVSTVNNLKVNVLGTSFNVYSRKNMNEEIKVATGLVGVVDANSTTFLKAGEQLNYSLTNNVARKSRVDVRDATSLQNGTLYFSKSTTKQIAEKLERYYNIHIEIAPSATKHHAFSGEIKDYGIARVLDGIGFVTGTKYKFTNPNTILLY